MRLGFSPCFHTRYQPSLHCWEAETFLLQYLWAIIWSVDSLRLFQWLSPCIFYGRDCCGLQKKYFWTTMLIDDPRKEFSMYPRGLWCGTSRPLHPKTTQRSYSTVPVDQRAQKIGPIEPSSAVQGKPPISVVRRWDPGPPQHSSGPYWRKGGRGDVWQPWHVPCSRCGTSQGCIVRRVGRSQRGERLFTESSLEHQIQKDASRSRYESFPRHPKFSWSGWSLHRVKTSRIITCPLARYSSGITISRAERRGVKNNRDTEKTVAWVQHRFCFPNSRWRYCLVPYRKMPRNLALNKTVYKLTSC